MLHLARLLLRIASRLLAHHTRTASPQTHQTPPAHRATQMLQEAARLLAPPTPATAQPAGAQAPAEGTDLRSPQSAASRGAAGQGAAREGAASLPLRPAAPHPTARTTHPADHRPPPHTSASPAHDRPFHPRPTSGGPVNAAEVREHPTVELDHTPTVILGALPDHTLHAYQPGAGLIVIDQASRVQPLTEPADQAALLAQAADGLYAQMRAADDRVTATHARLTQARTAIIDYAGPHTSRDDLNALLTAAGLPPVPTRRRISITVTAHLDTDASQADTAAETARAQLADRCHGLPFDGLHIQTRIDPAGTICQ